MHGRGTATRLKRISKSKVWSPEVRDAAARLLRTWRGVVDVSGTAQPPKAKEKLSRRQEKPDDDGGRTADPKGKRRAAHAKVVTESGGEGKKPEDASRSKRNTAASISDTGVVSSRPDDDSPKHSCPPPQQLQDQNQQRSPERPSLVPATLWDRLSQEYNFSQLSAIWAAAASALEARQEGRNAAGGTNKVGGVDHPGGAVAEPIERRTPVNGAAATAATATSRRAGEGGAFRGGGKGGIVLLQGPPGTGKTRTILGVVSAILARGEEKDSAGRGGSFDVCGGGGRPAGSTSAGVGDRGMGTTLEVGTKQKRPGLAGRWVAAKTHQRVSEKHADMIRSCTLL